MARRKAPYGEHSGMLPDACHPLPSTELGLPCLDKVPARRSGIPRQTGAQCRWNRLARLLLQGCGTSPGTSPSTAIGSSTIGDGSYHGNDAVVVTLVSGTGHLLTASPIDRDHIRGRVRQCQG